MYRKSYLRVANCCKDTSCCGDTAPPGRQGTMLLSQNPEAHIIAQNILKPFSICNRSSRMALNASTLFQERRMHLDSYLQVVSIKIGVAVRFLGRSFSSLCSRPSMNRELGTHVFLQQPGLCRDVGTHLRWRDDETGRTKRLG